MTTKIGGRTKTSWDKKWKSGKTQVIRVPSELVPAILNYARALDNGQINPEIIAAIDKFIEIKRQEYGKNSAQTGSFSTNTPRWYVFNQFRAWVQSII